MLRWMRYLWIVSRQFTAKVFAHRLVLKQKLVMVSFQSEITEVPAGWRIKGIEKCSNLRYFRQNRKSVRQCQLLWVAIPIDARPINCPVTLKNSQKTQ